MEFPEVTPEVFYKAGIICFSIMAFGNSVNLMLIARNITGWAFLSSTAGIAFNIVIIGFFAYMLKNAKIQTTTNGATLTENELENAFKLKESKK